MFINFVYLMTTGLEVERVNKNYIKCIYTLCFMINIVLPQYQKAVKNVMNSEHMEAHL